MTERVIMDSVWEIATGQSFDALGMDASISLALVTGMEPRTALGILKAVFRARHPKDADALDKIADKLSKLLGVRNVIAHGKWRRGKRPRTIECTTFFSSTKLRAEVHAFTPDELNSTADRIKDCTWRLADFLQAHGYWKPSKPAEQFYEPTPEPQSRKRGNNRRKRDLKLP
jgi:hypothetical protein